MHPTLLPLSVLTLALSGVHHVFAQVPPPAPPGPLATPSYGSTGSPIVSGRVKQFLPNPNGEVDGLLLADGTQVNFPPHLTASLLQVVHVGDPVSVQGFRGLEGSAVHATVITNTATTRSMVDQPPSPDRPPPSPPALAALSADGHVVQLLHADMGELSGAILDDGTVVRWPPPFGAQLQAVLQANSSLKASGFGSQNSFGRALEATSLAVNGQAPLTVYGPRPNTPPAPPGQDARPPMPK